jgi:hypothetical protein
MTPLTDQRQLYNADHLLKERNAVLELILELPKLTIKEFEDRLFVMTQRAKPLEQRLEEYGEKFAEEAKNK